LESAIRKWIEKKEKELMGNQDSDEDEEESGKKQKSDTKSEPRVDTRTKQEQENEVDHFEVVMDDKKEDMIPVKKSMTFFNSKFLKETIERLKTEDFDNCPVCLSDVEDAVITICSHIACRYCMIGSIEKTSMCPICRTILTRKDFMTVPRYVKVIMVLCCSDSRFSFDVEKKFKRSSKLESLMGHIQEVIELKEKCVIFSQFLGMLSLIEHDLNLNKIQFLVSCLSVF
jgi:DNA repair protein RAD5